MAIDVGDHRAIQNSLLQSEERLRLVSRVTTDVIWDWDLETDETWHNDGLQKVFGYANADSIRDWISHLHPEDRDRVRQSITAHAQAGQGFWETRYRLRRGDGGYAHVCDRGLVVHDEQGKPVRMIGAMVDITRQVQTEEGLQLAARGIASIPEGPTALAQNMHILSVNPG